MSNSCAVSFQAGSPHYTTPNPNNLSTQVKATHFCKHFQEQDLSLQDLHQVYTNG